MPLFHVHGLIAGVLASLAAGGRVFCTSGPHAPQFFDWLSESQATWYTATPTVHQAIVARGQLYAKVVAQKPLRFIRSCSAPLPPKVLADLEAVFGVPAIESYGMTEGSHQICSNPLPPAQHKPASVGLPTGVEVAVVDSRENSVALGQSGEVVLRGPTIFTGYENNPEANASAFRDGWFRTGDQGYFDSEGYLFLNGRFKELINRAAVKISPREVDEALLDHSSVEQAVTFAIPDPRLGEDVGAAVVLKKGLCSTERELREFAARTLSDFKVPRRIFIVEKIPKGPTGKLQRIGMAKKLGLSGPDDASSERQIDFVGPRTALESRLAEIWADVLRLPIVGVYNDFFALGGDSILAAQLLTRVSQAMQVELSLIRFIEAPTIAAQAMVIEGSNSSKPHPLLTPIQTSGSRRPFFCVPPAADVIGFLDLAPLLGPEQPFYPLQPSSL
jgi:hypothetical protein